MEHLTIESLARAIHEDQQKATENCRMKVDPKTCAVMMKWEDLGHTLQAIRREQARLMFERIMR